MGVPYQSQQVGLERCDSDDKLEVHPKVMEPQSFRKDECGGGRDEGWRMLVSLSFSHFRGACF